MRYRSWILPVADDTPYGPTGPYEPLTDDGEVQGTTPTDRDVPSSESKVEGEVKT